MRGVPVLPWVVAVVDDEPGIHDVTRLVLRRLKFDGRPIECVFASSAAQGRELFASRQDIAVALIDVVMENDRAGLELVEHLRRTVGNVLTRIILRTGQPGMAPEREVVTHFEIDDYRDKSELSADRLQTAVVTALRSFRTLQALDQNVRALTQISEVGPKLFEAADLTAFAQAALQALTTVGASAPSAVPSGFFVAVQTGQDGSADRLEVLATAGPGWAALQGQAWSLAAHAPAAEGQPGRTQADLTQRVAHLRDALGHGEVRAWPQGLGLCLQTSAPHRLLGWLDAPGEPAASTLDGEAEVPLLMRLLVGRLVDALDTRQAVTQRLEAASREREMRVRSRFLTRVGHELRTPLNAMLGFAQLMIDEEGDAEAALPEARLRHIMAAGRHLQALIDDVMDLSRLESGEFLLTLAAVPVAEVAEQVRVLTEGLALTRGVAVRVEVAEALGVQADATRLRQVLLNLVSNAIKYNRPQGSVLVRAQADGSGQGGVLLEVCDTGHGMTPAQLQQLFQPFNRLGAERTAVEGTGVGLAIVKALTERMGGSVEVHSRVDEGSTFKVRMQRAELASPLLASASKALPISTSAPEPGSAPPAPSCEQGVCKVLYVEDNAVNALILSEWFRRRPSFVMEVAEDGRTGLERALAWAPALILLDMQLPDMDGLEVLRALKADPRTRAIPVVGLSAQTLGPEVDEHDRNQLSGYLLKPFDFAEVERVLAQTLGAPSGA
jgi:signal transduction histidine kinase/DNA-binding response OmpR family regulator